MSYRNNKNWRKKHPARWQSGKRRYYKQFQKNDHSKNQIWSLSDVAIIVMKLDIDRNLSKQLGRSVNAIQVMRSRMKGEGC